MKKDIRRLRFVSIISILGTILWLVLPIAPAWADEETGTFRGLGPHATVSGTLDGEHVSYTGGTMRFELSSGDVVPTFCTDLRHHVSAGNTFVTSDEVMACEIRWLLLHYPPLLSGSNAEMAARQAAVWHFSDGFIPDSERAWEIINAVPDDPCEADQPSINITPASAVIPIDTTQTFTVTVTRSGTPVNGQVVALITDYGTLSTDTVTTDDQGQATFTLTHDTPDTTSHVNASAEMLLPVGTIFVGTEPNRQKLVLGEEVLGSVHADAIATWTGTGAVTTLSFDDYNMDSDHDAGEPLLEGWTVELYKYNGDTQNLIATRSTDSAGTASFTGLSAGDYRVVEILQSDWYTTTPLEIEFTLASGESRSFVFGQIKLPVIVGHVFQDDDADGTPDAEEPPLEGWELQVYRQDGSIVVGMQGATGEDGSVIFSSHPDRDPPEIPAGGYFVQETIQEGWYTTTGISQTVTVGSGDIGHTWLGNLHPEPDLALDKTGPAMAHEGDEITYVFTVTNTGNVPLTGVTVDDPLLGGTVCTLGTLQPDEAATCDVAYTVPAEIGDSVENTATATGSEPYLGGEATGSASASTSILYADIEVVKTASVDTVDEGDPVEWSITVYNRGDTTLYDVTVSDSNGKTFGPLTLTAGDGDDEAGSDQATWSYQTYPTYDTINVATASGADILGLVVTDQGQTSVEVTPAGDTDGDGIPDYLDSDSDGDGIPNEVEGEGDTDGDGIPDYLDTDSDGDGIPDAIEGTGDMDGDGLPNYLDTDSDGDSIPDAIEGTGDVDGDGLPNFLDTDSDGDGIPDQVEWNSDADGDGDVDDADRDADGDGTPNFLDTDSDGDGIPDSVEWNVDADGDGDVDDSDRDADGDGIPNFLDTDSDGDGIPDAEEGTGDVDGDGIPNFVDPDEQAEDPHPYRIYLSIILN